MYCYKRPLHNAQIHPPRPPDKAAGLGRARPSPREGDLRYLKRLICFNVLRDACKKDSSHSPTQGRAHPRPDCASSLASSGLCRGLQKGRTAWHHNDQSNGPTGPPRQIQRHSLAWQPRPKPLKTPIVWSDACPRTHKARKRPPYNTPPHPKLAVAPECPTPVSEMFERPRPHSPALPNTEVRPK